MHSPVQWVNTGGESWRRGCTLTVSHLAAHDVGSSREWSLRKKCVETERHCLLLQCWNVDVVNSIDWGIRSHTELTQTKIPFKAPSWNRGKHRKVWGRRGGHQSLRWPETGDEGDEWLSSPCMHLLNVEFVDA